ncbi:hypothetical protein ACN5YO_001941 [Vibrio parahaemolyticus]|nr:hypothetical protein [Vibrio parahaemolyticus]MBE4481563.1 hypothetical protein [Vibrio parahaemolyticus]MBE5135290.1 hypothetical protein [Vibrio parahaemolyticus]HCM1323856.1 hypothetical protein [Vibrio parahaemolyticus]
MEYKNLDLDDETVKELEDMWDEQRASFFSWWKSTDSSPIAEHPLAALAYCLEAGVYPPPSVLLQIADTYKGYVHKQGEIGLEEAYFGKPIKGMGNYAARKAKSFDVMMLNTAIQLETLTTDEKKRRSQVEIAEEYLDRKGSEEDPEHLLRKLRRLRQKMK